MLMILVKISVVIFMAGNLLDMGLRLNPQDAGRGLRDFRFVALTLVWGFVLAPALAYVIAHLMPLEEHYALGLVLMGMAPCAPFVPALVAKGKGDLGYTAAFMLLSAVGTVVFMPLAVPFMVKGLTITAWTVAKPLLIVVLLPLVVGVAILRASPTFAGKLLPIVKKVTGIATLAVAVLFVLVYGKELLSVAGTLRGRRAVTLLCACRHADLLGVIRDAPRTEDRSQCGDDDTKYRCRDCAPPIGARHGRARGGHGRAGSPNHGDVRAVCSQAVRPPCFDEGAGRRYLVRKGGIGGFYAAHTGRRAVALLACCASRPINFLIK